MDNGRQNKMELNGEKWRCFRAALHTHSTVSDGHFTPDEVIRRYSEAGYDVLAFTDHRTANPVSRYDGRGMTLISGIELHPDGPRGITWHLLALGVPEDFRNPENASGQETVDAVNAAGGIVFAAHPYWCGFRSDEVLTLRGIIGTEVFNSSTRYIGKALNMQLWDEILDRGEKFPAIAVDDAHQESDFFHGWTVICAENETPAALLQALKSGRFYASQGPEFHEISYRDGVFTAKFTPCAEVILMTGQSRGWQVRGMEQSGELTTSFRLEIPPDAPLRYLRCQLRDQAGNYAWSMPFYC